MSDNMRDNGNKKGDFSQKSEAKVCPDLENIPGGGRLAVPDLIKEILTGSGDTEKQVRDISNSLVHPHWSRNVRLGSHWSHRYAKCPLHWFFMA